MEYIYNRGQSDDFGYSVAGVGPDRICVARLF